MKTGYCLSDTKNYSMRSWCRRGHGKNSPLSQNFFTNCTSLENRVKYGTSLPAAYKECLVPELYMRLFSYGSRVFNKQLNVEFDSPQTLKAYVNFKSTLKYAKPDYKTATDISVVSDFLNGETAMLITYPSFLSNITDLRTISLIGENRVQPYSRTHTNSWWLEYWG